MRPTAPPLPTFTDTIAPAAGFIPGSDCSPLARYQPPQVGTVFRYRREDGSLVARTVARVEGDAIVVTTPTANPQSPTVSQATVGGMFPLPRPSVPGRQLEYAQPPMAVLATLAVGQTATVPVEETTRFGAQPVTTSVPVVVKYEACGTVSVQGEALPARVYRLSSAGLSQPRGQQATVRRTTNVFYLSNTEGYPLIYQGQAVTMVTDIRRPAGR